MRVWPVTLVLVLAGTAAWPTAAAAHAFAQRYDLPLPLGYYLAGAGAAIALSFLGSFLIRRPLPVGFLSVVVPIPRWLSAASGWLLRIAALALLVGVAVTGLLGPESPTHNFATVFVWVIWWVGIVLFAALVIEPWSAGNPFRLIVDATLWLAGRHRPMLPAPRWLGLLSVLGLLGIAWIEIVSEWSEDPRATVVIAGGYLLVLLAGSIVFGAPAWFGAADPVSRLFGLLGHVAPLAVEPGRLRLRLPASGLIAIELGVIGAVFAVTLIGLVLFDGLSETPFWAMVLDYITRSQSLRPWLLDLRAGGVDILKLVYTLGQLATVATALLAYAGLALVIRLAAGPQQSWRRVFSGFAGSLLPIAVAYHLAHYLSYLLLAGQLILPIASDPLGNGQDLFGDAHRTIDLGAITARQVWWIAAAALVTGHALGVLVSHAEALRLYQGRRQAIASQVPMMLFMVGLTVLSLWILAQPIVV